MLVAVFITQMFFTAIFLSAIVSNHRKDRSPKPVETPNSIDQLTENMSYAEGLRDGEESALKNHRKVLDAYHRLFPNAR